MIWENATETCKLSYVKQITSLGLVHDTGCSGLVHWDDPEGWDEEGGGRGVQDGEHMYSPGRFKLHSPLLLASKVSLVQKMKASHIKTWPQGTYPVVQWLRLTLQMQRSWVQSLVEELVTRLLSLWDSPGKNTKVGFHFLLQGILLTQGLNPFLLQLLDWESFNH